MIKFDRLKHNCYECEYRGTIPGDAHSCCNHPLVKKNKTINNPLVELLQLFGSVGRVQPFTIAPKKMNMKFNEYGVKNNWCFFPFNFDPIWIENCNGFKSNVPKRVAESL